MQGNFENVFYKRRKKYSGADVSAIKRLRKMVLIAVRSVFELFSADEETFANSQLWKNLLRRTCVVPLWQGERNGVRVEVWGNRQSVQEAR